MYDVTVVNAEAIDRKVWSIPEALSIGSGGFFLLWNLLGILTRLFRRYGLSTWLTWFQQRELKTLISVVVVVLILTPLILLLLRKRQLGGWWQSIEWKAGRYIYGSIISGAVLAIVWSLGITALHGTPGSFREGALSVILCILSDVIVSPAVEEMYFRGILFVALANRFGSVISIVIVTIIFTFVHPGHWFYVFPAAVVFGIARLKTKSVASCFALHSSYNFFLLLYLLLIQR